MVHIDHEKEWREWQIYQRLPPEQKSELRRQRSEEVYQQIYYGTGPYSIPALRAHEEWSRRPDRKPVIVK